MTKINTDDQKILNNKRESEIVRAIIHDIEKFIFAKIKKSKNKKTGQIDFYIYRWNYIDEYEINIVSLRICAYCKYGKCDDIILPLYSIIQQHIQYSKDAKIISRKYGNINALKLFTQMIRNHCTRYFFYNEEDQSVYTCLYTHKSNYFTFKYKYSTDSTHNGSHKFRCSLSIIPN